MPILTHPVRTMSLVDSHGKHCLGCETNMLDRFLSQCETNCLPKTQNTNDLTERTRQFGMYGRRRYDKLNAHQPFLERCGKKRGSASDGFRLLVSFAHVRTPPGNCSAHATASIETVLDSRSGISGVAGADELCKSVEVHTSDSGNMAQSLTIANFSAGTEVFARERVGTLQATCRSYRTVHHRTCAAQGRSSTPQNTGSELNHEPINNTHCCAHRKANDSEASTTSRTHVADGE